MQSLKLTALLFYAVLLQYSTNAYAEPVPLEHQLQIADSLMRHNQLDSAILLYTTFIEQAQQEPDKGPALIGLGQSFLLKNKPDSALQVFIRAVDILKKSPQGNTLLAEAYSGIAIIHAQNKQLATATSYFKMALGLLPNQDSLRLKIMTNLAGVYLEQKQYRPARQTFQEALTLSRRLGLRTVEAVILTNLSNLYITQKEWSLAEKHAQNSLTLRQELNMPVSTITLNNLGYASVQLGKLKAGIAAYTQAMPNASATEKLQLLDNLQQAYLEQSDYRSAVTALHQLIGLKDSLHQLNMAEKIAEINTAYETAEKQQQITTLQAENQVRKNQLAYWIGGSSILFFFILTVVWLRLRNLRTRQALEQSKIKQQLLRAQLNPHFIFNALDKVKQFIHHHDAEKSTTYLTEFASLMRLILETSDKIYVSLSDELDMLRHYLIIQQMGSKAPFDFVIKVEPGLDTEDVSIPVMLLQPFVENAVIHGLKHRIDGLIQITVSRKNNILLINITDNGKGMLTTNNEKEPASRRSFGNAIVRQQIEEYNKTHKQPIVLQISPAENDDADFPGTCISLSIPMFD
ncbi:tetratricopeptide repeat-containing sensor histidine kinase [Olivibacter sitiensis]|uniref:tetratricopeptide repeat-containing sensor histidine kinase n=1 Tax=Olivibacter sitiensis TaxID=376470 RepID=UPI0012F7D7A5|nr:tetratricopeptide repeat protein [Olivibacter sitiensis]